MADRICTLSPAQYVLLTAWLLVCTAGVALTVGDKLQAKRGRRRVPERTLLLWGLAGAALPMLLTMVLIRHKIRKTRLLLCFLLEIIVQILLFVMVYFYLL